MFDRSRLITDLERDEGNRSLLYDDFTAQNLKTGMVIRGNPTIGIGWCVSRQPVSPERAQIIAGWFADDKAAEIENALQWFESLDDVRSRALMNMAYQMGVQGVLDFQSMLSAMRIGRWELASDAALDSSWARQTPARAKRIAQMIRTGVDI